MPFYTVYHRSPLPVSYKEKIAEDLTELHFVVTGAPREAVKVFFLPADNDSFFSGGERKQGYVRVFAQIRYGRSEEQKSRILRGIFEIVKGAIEGTSGDGEVQSQIIEFDDTKTVMTNGVMNE